MTNDESQNNGGQTNNGQSNNGQATSGRTSPVQENLDNIMPPAYTPGLVGAGLQPGPRYAHIIRELTRINLDLTNLYLDNVNNGEQAERQRRDQQNRVRMMMLENINRNHCVRRRNAAFYRINPVTADLQPLISVLVGVTIENFPKTMEDLNRLSARDCMAILSAIKAPFDRNGSAEYLRELIREEWCPLRVESRN